MNKQKKQLIILGALVLVAGIVAVVSLSGGDSTPKKDPKKKETAKAPPAKGPAAPKGAPKGAPDPAAAAAEAERTTPQPLPAAVDRFFDRGFTWRIGEDNLDGNGLIAYDPMHVQNLEVVEPGRRKYIENFRKAWQIEGVTETHQMVTHRDAEGRPLKDEAGNEVQSKQLVKEVWFKGIRRPYRENDRLTNTRFTIKQIIRNMEETSVDLVGDNQEKLKLQLAKPDRYAPGTK